MSFTRKWQARTSVAVGTATSCLLLVLACSASGARAEVVVPVQGGWVATTSAALPVSFEVKEGNVLNAHFRFNWGFCGTFESRLSNTNPIDANGHWSFEDSRGQTIEATFVAPDRAEGTVVTVERQLPGCPSTQATFVAAPGEVPHIEPQVFAVQNVNTGHISKRPREIVLGQHGSLSFYGLRWRSFGGRRAYAVGKAQIRKGRRSWHPRASVRLSSLVEDGPDRRIYSIVRYVLHGSVPHGFAHRGFQFVG
jgi:hypothetical protein